MSDRKKTIAVLFLVLSLCTPTVSWTLQADASPDGQPARSQTISGDDATPGTGPAQETFRTEVVDRRVEERTQETIEVYFSRFLSWLHSFVM